MRALGGFDMRLIHNSRDAAYRSPFGAVTEGTTVELKVRVEDIDPLQVDMTLRTWIDCLGESLIPMTRGGDGVFTASLPCPEPTLVWYSFHATLASGDEAHLGAPQGATGGEGAMYPTRDVPSFQISVYRYREIRPEWYERGMVYQIFPDRYARDAAWRSRALPEVERDRKGRANASSGIGTPLRYTSAHPTVRSRPGISTADRSRASVRTCRGCRRWALPPST